jgi:hypothetical protein
MFVHQGRLILLSVKWGAFVCVCVCVCRVLKLIQGPEHTHNDKVLGQELKPNKHKMCPPPTSMISVPPSGPPSRCRTATPQLSKARDAQSQQGKLWMPKKVCALPHSTYLDRMSAAICTPQQVSNNHSAKRLPSIQGNQQKYTKQHPP